MNTEKRNLFLSTLASLGELHNGCMTIAEPASFLLIFFLDQESDFEVVENVESPSIYVIFFSIKFRV